MCGYFDEGYGLSYRELTPPSPALIDRARKIEAAMEGERVPESEWETFFTPVCGAIEWKYFERMFRCRKLALNYLAVQAPARRLQTKAEAFRCAID
jgi:hypothetical protein